MASRSGISLKDNSEPALPNSSAFFLNPLNILHGSFQETGSRSVWKPALVQYCLGHTGLILHFTRSPLTLTINCIPRLAVMNSKCWKCCDSPFALFIFFSYFVQIKKTSAAYYFLSKPILNNLIQIAFYSPSLNSVKYLHNLYSYLLI